MSAGLSSTVCVCEPRHVCTLAISFGFLMSLMSNTRTPRMRSLLTGAGTPPGLQSMRPFCASADMNIRFLYTDTSFCDAGHSYATTSVGLDGLLISHTTGPL